MNPNGKRYCPRCHEEFYLSTCDIVATTNVPPYAVGETIYNASTKDQMKAPKKIEPLQPYMKHLGKRVCPHCDYLLPSNIDTTPIRNIAVVGDFRSGKSHYIAALIKHLESLQIVSESEFFRINCMTSDIKKIYEQDYFNRLFAQKIELERNIPLQPGEVIDPLIYELTFKRSKHHLPESVNIAIHDLSGEHFQSQQGIMEYARHVIVNAGALIYLANPMAMPEIEKYVLKTYPHIIPLGEKRMPSEILNTVIGLIEMSRGLPGGSRLTDLPIAIAISKADLIDRLRPVPQKFTFSNNPVYKGGINLYDLDKVQREVVDVIKRYSGDYALLSATQTIEKRRFFAISATGNPSDSSGAFPSVIPRRCLDPLLWILHEWKILQKTGA